MYEKDEDGEGRGSCPKFETYCIVVISIFNLLVIFTIFGQAWSIAHFHE